MKKHMVSAIIACYKDEKAIPFMHDRLTNVFKKIGVKYEIIFVNDGSPDNSEFVLKNIVKRDRHTIAVNHSRNFNSQMAFTSGMDIARGDAVVLLDGDLQDPPEMIEKFYQKWMKGYDVVYGIRVKREAPLLMCLSMGILALLCVAVGLSFPYVLDYLIYPAVKVLLGGASYARLVMGG